MVLPQFGRSGRKANIQGRVRGVQFEATVCHTHWGKSIEAEGHVVLKGVILGFSRGCEHVRTDRAPFGRAIRRPEAKGLDYHDRCRGNAIGPSPMNRP
jgi:hypothetical protein